MKKICRSILFFVILFILVELSMFILIPRGESSKYNFLQAGENEILQENEKSIEALIIGDSLVTSSVNPIQIWYSYGYPSYVMDATNSDMSDIYNSLESAINYQNLKVVILESNILFKEYSDGEMINNISKKIMNIVPIYKYHSNWKNIFNKNTINTYKGYHFISDMNPSTNYNYMESTSEVGNFPDGNDDWLIKIIRLCKKYNIEFVVLSTPSQKMFNYKNRTALIRLSHELNFNYMDYNLGNPLGIDWRIDTSDNGIHLNYLGAIKVSKYVGQFLYTTRKMTDYRNDKKYASWNDAHEKYIEEYKSNLG